MSNAQNMDVISADDEFDDEIVEDHDATLDEFGGEAGLPGRPRRVLVNRYSAGLVVVLVGAACFYGGVRLEKADVGSGSTSSVSAFGSRSTAGAARTGTGSTAGGRSTSSGALTGAPGGAAAGGGTEGTIATIDGDTLYVTESSGSTVKVKLSDLTTLTKTVTVSKRSLYPGDTVTVTGTAGSGGTVSATALSDSGASSSSSSDAATTSSSNSSSSSSSSGLSSLFSG